jgi:endonuclease/exonuclease/phosphatase family protein
VPSEIIVGPLNDGKGQRQNDMNWRMIRTTFMIAAVAFLVLLITGYSGAQTVRCTTWNLQWFPNGSAHEASAAQQNQRIKEAADVLRPINPDIVLLQEVRDYDACARLGEAIAPGIYQVAICSAFREPFQSGLGKQQVAILSKYQAQAAWAEPWKSMNGVDPPRGFAFAWFKIGTRPARPRPRARAREGAENVHTRLNENGRNPVFFTTQADL